MDLTLERILLPLLQTGDLPESWTLEC
uniref:Uncharacterized protein n=1 Tax=Arundo donax TaxID=35708 RepID=A0A0A9G5V1_ARUDO